MQETKLTTKRDTSVITQQQAMYLLKTIWKDAPDTEIIKAAIFCRQYNLNPLMGHIFLIKFDKYDKQGAKVGEEWAMVRGIKAKRAMAQEKHRYSYKVGPRVVTDEEQKSIFGEVEADKIWALVILKNKDGNEYPGYGFWPKAKGVYGSEKGNSPRNMAFIRAEANALDKLEPGKLPEMDTIDDNFVVSDFQNELAEGKEQFISNTEQDIAELWGSQESTPPVKQVKKSMTTVELLTWVTDMKGFGAHKTARTWLVNTLKIDEKRIDSEPEKVYQEIKDKVK